MTKEIKDYYVYAASIWGEVVYVGMGRKDRMSHVNSGKSHNADLNKMHFLHGYISVKKVKEGMTKPQALKEEARYIDMYLPVCNKQGISMGMYGMQSVKKYTLGAVHAFFTGVVDYIAERAKVSSAKRNTTAINEVAHLLIGVLGNPRNINTKDTYISAPHVKSKLLLAFPEFFGNDAGNWEFMKSIVRTEPRRKNSDAMYVNVTDEFRTWYVTWYSYCFGIADEVLVEKVFAEHYSVEQYIH